MRVHCARAARNTGQCCVAQVVGQPGSREARTGDIPGTRGQHVLEARATREVPRFDRAVLRPREQAAVVSVKRQRCNRIAAVCVCEPAGTAGLYAESSWEHRGGSLFSDWDATDD